MLHVVMGGQRSGKTYWCVYRILEYLRNTLRPIATNLPLNLAAIQTLAGEKIDVFSRVTILTKEQMQNFWMHIQPNSVVFLDELYEHFGARHTKTLPANVHDELLAYTRQHGHFKDDLFLVSHSKDDLDVTIRRGVQETIVLVNALHLDMFGGVKFFGKLLGGLKFPKQFFIASYYLRDDLSRDGKKNEPYRVQRLFPLGTNDPIFSCYDSFSTSDLLAAKEGCGEGACSSDYGVGYWKRCGRPWVHDTWYLWLGLVVGVCFAYYMVTGFFKALTGQASKPATVATSGTQGGLAGAGAGRGGAAPAPAPPKPLVPVAAPVVVEDDRPMVRELPWAKIKVSLVSVELREGRGIPVDWSLSAGWSHVTGGVLQTVEDWKLVFSLPEDQNLKIDYYGTAWLRAGEPWRLHLGSYQEVEQYQYNQETGGNYRTGTETREYGLDVELCGSPSDALAASWVVGWVSRDRSAPVTRGGIAPLLTVDAVASLKKGQVIEVGRIRRKSVDRRAGPWGILDYQLTRWMASVQTVEIDQVYVLQLVDSGGVYGPRVTGKAFARPSVGAGVGSASSGSYSGSSAGSYSGSVSR